MSLDFAKAQVAGFIGDAGHATARMGKLPVTSELQATVGLQKLEGDPMPKVGGNLYILLTGVCMFAIFRH